MNKVLALSVAAIVLACAALLVRGGGDAPRAKVVGVLQFNSYNLDTLEGFKAGLRDLGYGDGPGGVDYVFHGPVARPGDIDDAMRRLMAAKPDLIFASTTPAGLAAKRMAAQAGIPVVVAPMNDPVASGLVLAPLEPEANVTGVRLSPSEGRRLQSLTKLAGGVRRVLVPYTPGDASAAASLEMLAPAARALGVRLAARPFPVPPDGPPIPAGIPRGVDAVLLPRDGWVLAHTPDFVKACKERKLPLSVPRFSLVKAGALEGYGFIGFELGKQAAGMAHLLLSGVPVRSVPVETAREYFFINLETARTIGLSVDDATLRRARRIVR